MSILQGSNGRWWWHRVGKVNIASVLFCSCTFLCASVSVVYACVCIYVACDVTTPCQWFVHHYYVWCLQHRGDHVDDFFLGGIFMASNVADTTEVGTRVYVCVCMRMRVCVCIVALVHVLSWSRGKWVWVGKSWGWRLLGIDMWDW